MLHNESTHKSIEITGIDNLWIRVCNTNLHPAYMKNDSIVAIAKDTECETKRLLCPVEMS